MDKIIELFKTYTAALPTSVVAVILLIVGLFLFCRIKSVA